MALTEATMLARVKSVLIGAGFTESQGLTWDFETAGTVDGAFLARLTTEAAEGGINFSEEVRGIVTVDVARQTGFDQPATEAVLLADARTVINALVRDGAQVSGEYIVEDAGRSVVIEVPDGAGYGIARVRVPVNFEASL